MDIKFCRDLFTELCQKYNHPIPPINANGRLKRTMGRVNYSFSSFGEKLSATIEFSTSFLVSSSEEDVKQVVLHEFAHYHLLLTDPENAGHTQQFRDFCKEIGCTHTGAKNTSNTMFKDIGALKSVGYKYILKCPECGAIVGRYKTKCQKVQYAHMCKTSCCNRVCVVEKL